MKPDVVLRRRLRMHASTRYCHTPNPHGFSNLWRLSRFAWCAHWVFRKPEQALLPPKPDFNLTTAIFKSANLILQEVRSNCEM